MFVDVEFEIPFDSPTEFLMADVEFRCRARELLRRSRIDVDGLDGNFIAPP